MAYLFINQLNCASCHTQIKPFIATINYILIALYLVHAAVSATPHKKIIAGMNVELQLVVTIIASSVWLHYT